MHAYLTSLFWFNIGKYGAVAVFLAGSWLAEKLASRRRRLNRSRRERLSALPAADPGWTDCPGCPIAHGPHLHVRTEPATCMHGVTSPCGLCGEFARAFQAGCKSSGRPESWLPGEYVHGQAEPPEPGAPWYAMAPDRPEATTIDSDRSEH